MATAKRVPATRIGGGARGGQKMYLGGSKRFDERTGTYRGGGPAPRPPGKAVGYGKTPAAARRGAVAGAGRAAALQQMQKAMTKQASMRGAIGARGGPGAANRQAMRSAMVNAKNAQQASRNAYKATAAKRRAR